MSYAVATIPLRPKPSNDDQLQVASVIRASDGSGSDHNARPCGHSRRQGRLALASHDDLGGHDELLDSQYISGNQSLATQWTAT